MRQFLAEPKELAQLIAKAGQCLEVRLRQLSIGHDRHPLAVDIYHVLIQAMLTGFHETGRSGKGDPERRPPVDRHP